MCLICHIFLPLTHFSRSNQKFCEKNARRMNIIEAIIFDTWIHYLCFHRTFYYSEYLEWSKKNVVNFFFFISSILQSNEMKNELLFNVFFLSQKSSKVSITISMHFSQQNVRFYYTTIHSIHIHFYVEFIHFLCRVRNIFNYNKNWLNISKIYVECFVKMAKS